MPPEQPVVLPRPYAVRIVAFLGQRLTGNIQINVRNGVVEGVRIEEVVKKVLDADG